MPNDLAWNRFFAADDWGFSPAINRAMIQLARDGCLRSVSLAVNTDHVRVGLEEILQESASIEFALHFNLTYGKPLSAPREIPSLVDTEGRFLSHRQLLCRGICGQLRAVDIQREFLSQLRCLRDLGVSPTGLNGHHHVHLFPPVARALLALPEAQALTWRLMGDTRHVPSFLQTAVFRVLVHRRPAKAETCLYLRPRDWRSRAAFTHRLARAGAHALLIHPATASDFDEVGMVDGLREERVREYTAIRRWLNTTEAVSP